MAGLKLDFSAIRELGKAIAGTTETRQQTKKAVVREITDGGAVVEIAGSGVLTPVESSTATYSVGDVVTVSNRGGKLHIDGDVSAPSVGAGYVRKTVQPVAASAFSFCPIRMDCMSVMGISSISTSLPSASPAAEIRINRRITGPVLGRRPD